MSYDKRLHISALLAVACIAECALAAPVPKGKPMIKCELKFVSKDADRPLVYDGLVVVTNVSKEVIDIGTTLGPAGSLDLRVKGPDGKAVETEPLASIYSPSLEVQPFPLKPAEATRYNVRLLGRVPDEKRVTGVYKVRAVFDFKGRVYESNEVEVKWPGEAKP